ncbi:alpha/beta-hydrolase [Fomitiporia mediterranea MF3/22]|uniref:alpha/beta-hydrolase n=1 Tax=Fomitiporia mediterranea (strain MF3/22) TaxID=694068 RepID=UPI000440761B|nr:alpha/beta-hydrolase [Fomitiporia mediterranea MF3/22]EJC98122.1 alpha/beta-hydrolase [Fomitiporia mediterranea MF3/22]
MGESVEQRPKPFTFLYKGLDHRNNYVDVFIPPKSSPGPLKSILYFHGGGLTVGNRRSWFPQWIYDRAMQAGYAFISADYTLLAPSTGHDVLEDIKGVFRYLEKELNKDLASAGSDATIDATSIIVSGSSAGGMCAYLAACHARPKPKGVLSLYGQGGDFLSSQYLSIKTEPFFLNREILDPDVFQEFLYPFPPDLKSTSDSALAYYPANHPIAPGMPANLRMQLCRLYLQLGVYLDYYTGEHEPSLSARLRAVTEERHYDRERRVKALRTLIPEKHVPLFPQLLIDSSFPPTFMIHGELDSAVHSQESYNVARLLDSNGVKKVLRIANGEEHSFDYAEGAMEKYSPLFDEAFDFIKGIFEGA